MSSEIIAIRKIDRGLALLTIAHSRGSYCRANGHHWSFWERTPGERRCSLCGEVRFAGGD